MLRMSSCDFIISVGSCLISEDMEKGVDGGGGCGCPGGTSFGRTEPMMDACCC